MVKVKLNQLFQARQIYLSIRCKGSNQSAGRSLFHWHLIWDLKAMKTRESIRIVRVQKRRESAVWKCLLFPKWTTNSWQLQIVLTISSEFEPALSEILLLFSCEIGGTNPGPRKNGSRNKMDCERGLIFDSQDRVLGQNAGSLLTKCIWEEWKKN